MFSLINILLCIALIVYVQRAMNKSINHIRRASLMKITFDLRPDEIVQDFLADKDNEFKEKAKAKLAEPFGFTVYRDSVMNSSLVFYPEGVGVSLFHEIELDEDGLSMSLHLQEQCVKCEIPNLNYTSFGGSPGKGNIFKFPFGVIEAFLTKAEHVGELKKLPEFLEEHLKEHGFELATLSIAPETFNSCGAQWVSEDWEVRSDYNWNRFKSKYVIVSIIYFPFSAEELSPFEKRLISSDRYDHSGFTDRITKQGKVFKQIRALK